MAQRGVFRFVLILVLSLPLGFLALALAAPYETNIPGPLLVVFSPGLKIAEIIVPQQHESMGWTFGWFLRVAIGVNAIYFSMVLGVLAYLSDRRHMKKL